MKQLTCIAALIVVAVTACESPQDRTPSRATLSSATATRVVENLDTVDTETGFEASCLFVKREQHVDPEILLQEFLARDAAGDFLQSSEWFNGATACPGHEPGPDEHTAIAGYESRTILRSDTLARFEITTRILGAVTYTEFIPGPKVVVDTIEARHTKFGWRLTGHLLRQNVLASVDLERRRLPVEQLELLRRALNAAR
jgi:hypothetical protein